VSGHRLPDKELVRQDGSRTTLYRLLEDGRWVRLQLASDETIASNAGAMIIVALAPGANDGLFANLASVLVRPDGAGGIRMPIRMAPTDLAKAVRHGTIGLDSALPNKLHAGRLPLPPDQLA
jgi:hypothetical protein